MSIKLNSWILTDLLYESKFYGLKFTNRQAESVTDEMWDELEKCIQETGVKISDCKYAFKLKNLKSFTIPSRYRYLFDDELMNNSEELFRQCKHLKSANVYLGCCTDVYRGFNSCYKLMYLNLTINNITDMWSNFHYICYHCPKLKKVHFKFRNIQVLPDFIDMFDCEFSWKILTYLNHDYYRFHLSNESPKYCSSIVKTSYFDNRDLIHVESVLGSNLYNCKSLIV